MDHFFLILSESFVLQPATKIFLFWISIAFNSNILYLYQFYSKFACKWKFYERYFSGLIKDILIRARDAWSWDRYPLSPVKRCIEPGGKLCSNAFIEGRCKGHVVSRFCLVVDDVFWHVCMEWEICNHWKHIWLPICRLTECMEPVIHKRSCMIHQLALVMPIRKLYQPMASWEEAAWCMRSSRAPSIHCTMEEGWVSTLHTLEITQAAAN